MNELKLSVTIEVDDQDENAEHAKEIIRKDVGEDDELFIGESAFTVLNVELD
jgi:hypothetical protein